MPEPVTSGASAGAGAASVVRLAGLLVQLRLRMMWNAFRARPGGAGGLFVLLGVGAAAAYVTLLWQALDVLGRVAAAGAVAAGAPAAAAAARAQAAALALVAGAIAAASLTAKAAGGDAVESGNPENELFLARPVSLSKLVLARCLAGPVTDPFGALFMLPALLAGAAVWHLPAAAWLLAAATSVATQVAIAALAQAAHIAVARWVPRRHRPSAWVTMRLVSVVSVASVWVSATWVLRAPAWLAPRLPEIDAWLRHTPAAALVAPLVAFREEGAAAAAWALAPVVALAAVAVALGWLVAARAGMRGWEEAGAPFLDAPAAAGAAPAASLGPTRREWRLLRRDRPRLLSLVALPVIFVGMQLVGSLGWAWATATVDRVATIAYSFALYLATLGPLAHMQGERRAFWIAYTVPVPLGTLMAAKVKAWAPIVGGTAAVVFTALASQVPGARGADLALAGALVVAGAVTMTAVAVALAAAAADLTDPAQSAIGPGAVYLFLLVGGLFNMVLVARGPGALPLLVLYGAMAAATWRTGIARAGRCFDAEALARARVELSAAAMLLLAAALVPRALAASLEAVGAPVEARLVVRLVTLVLVGGAAALYLARRGRGGRRWFGRGRARPAEPPALPAPPVWRALVAAVGAGAAGALTCALAGGDRGAGAPPGAAAGVAVALLVAALAEELVVRGAVQRALEDDLARSRWRPTLARAVAALASVAAALLLTRELSAAGLAAAVAPAVARAGGGRLWAALLARALIVLALMYVAM